LILLFSDDVTNIVIRFKVKRMQCVVL